MTERNAKIAEILQRRVPFIPTEDTPEGKEICRQIGLSMLELAEWQAEKCAGALWSTNQGEAWAVLNAGTEEVK